MRALPLGNIPQDQNACAKGKPEITVESCAMKQPLGVILAGGLASRMGGGDKGLMHLGKRPLLSHVLSRLEPQVAAIALNANGDPARFKDFPVPVIADNIADFPGPLAGVLAGLDWAAEQGAESIVTVAADTPFFPMDLVPRLLLASEEKPHLLAIATTPRIGTENLKSGGDNVNRHPTFSLWPVALRDDLRHALNNGHRKMMAWIEPHHAGEALFDAIPFDPFFNVNTPADLAQAEQLLRDET